MAYQSQNEFQTPHFRSILYIMCEYRKAHQPFIGSPFQCCKLTTNFSYSARYAHFLGFIIQTNCLNMQNLVNFAPSLYSVD
ncbi:hypothetical protein HMPREF0673_01579 [Leyella stercorea DSM 18206]|uniref:Uncharacterized protein n=1 Tax=Leyella stercorea DSM 18206 TaxID=1002367 RepID=G6AY69_9BACT|nr:hypothetical protein HMPREF0673_01579 [Leyella stercorea DSM 18206]